MARADVVLGRFPTHLEAARPGKLLRSVVQAVCVELDDQAASLAAIRRSHRLRDVDERSDLLRIADHHDIGRTALALLELRLERTAELLRAVASAPAQGRVDAAERLLELWGLQVQVGTPRLALLTDSQDEIDLDGEAGQQALLRLAAAAAATLRESSRLALARRRVAGVIAVHAKGNGTVRAVLAGAANALDLDIGPIHSSADRYVHAAYATDRLRIDAPSQGPVTPSARKLRVAREVIGLEENPRERIETDAVARKHAERFDQLRRGFERTTLSIEITGEGVQNAPRTIGPMLVNRDEGRGVGFYGVVPSGKTLVFEDTGRVLLDGEDVTPRAYAFSGACFASDVPHPRDAVFGGDMPPAPGAPPMARFATATPAGALDPDFALPHAGHSLPMPGIGIGRTRLAFFVQEGHFSVGPTTGDPSGRRVAPRPAVAFRDLSVFAPAPGAERKPAARVRLAWIERRAYAARLLVPERFRAFEDDPDGNGVLRRLLESTARFKPAGISLDAKFVSDHWVLGEKVLGIPGADDPVAVLMTGARL